MWTKTGEEPEREGRVTGGGGAVLGLGVALDDRGLASASEAEAALEEAGEALRGREYQGEPGEGSPCAAALLSLLTSRLPPAPVSKSLEGTLAWDKS